MLGAVRPLGPDALLLPLTLGDETLLALDLGLRAPAVILRLPRVAALPGFLLALALLRGGVQCALMRFLLPPEVVVGRVARGRVAALAHPGVLSLLLLRTELRGFPLGDSLRLLGLGMALRLLVLANDALLFEADALARAVAAIDVGAERRADNEERDNAHDPASLAGSLGGLLLALEMLIELLVVALPLRVVR